MFMETIELLHNRPWLMAGISMILLSIIGLLGQWHSIWTITLLIAMLCFQLDKAVRNNLEAEIRESKTSLEIFKSILWKRWVILWFGLWFIVVFLRA